MAADSVGQIGLDLVVNKNGFEKQMSGIQGLAKKAGLALAAAFTVKKIVDFSAQCIELGSDLAEVQNVVDVTFPAMSRQIDQFAQDAAFSFGLSETMAKKFTGTFGAMAKAFGFSEQAAYGMSTVLTGLAGDVASFYNVSQDEAFTKLKSVFTGETESLKDLGIVMSQAALDQYAMANGFGKTTQAMSEGEKVALRYKFVTDQLSLASGDFMRTSDGWANQVRILKLQFDSLKATIGQGLINVLTPVIKVINSIISKLMSLANAFKAFTELITGKKGSSGTSVQASAAGMDAVAGAADHASEALGGAGGAAKKAAKDMKTSTTGIDELNVLSSDSGGGEGGSGGGGSGGGGAGGYSADEFDMGTMPADEMNSKYQGLIDKAKELAGLFKEGFLSGFGDLSVFDDIQNSIHGIGESLKDIFTDKEVFSSADQFLKSFVLNLGKEIGALGSAGATIADNLLGGINNYLQQNSGRIKEFLISIFDIGADIETIKGNFAEACAFIFSAFRSDSAKQITADLIGIFLNGFMGVMELVGRFVRDVADLLTAPFINNKDLIKTALEDTFSAVEPTFQTIKKIVDDVFTGLKTAYDTSIAPMFLLFKNGLSNIVTKLLESYNQYFIPIIQGMSDKFLEFKDQYLAPLIDKFLEFASRVSEAVTAVWVTFLQPFVTWFIETMAPVISLAVQGIIDVFFLFLDGASEVVGDVMDALGGLMKFITGVFTGDWKKAWDGIKIFFESIWKAMCELGSILMDAIYKVVSTILLALQELWNHIWDAVAKYFSDRFEAIKNSVTTILGNVQNYISDVITKIHGVIIEKLDLIKSKWDEIWGGAKNKVEEVFGGMWTFIKATINNILDGVETMANGVVKAINKMIEAVNSVADAVPGIGSELIPTIPEVHLPRLAQGGFVKANTPQLAMIGDNRHYGEIVAPEDKMQEMVDRAVAMAAGKGGLSDQYLSIIVDLLKKIIELIENLDLVVNIDIREIRKKLKDLEKRTGYGFS